MLTLDASSWEADSGLWSVLSLLSLPAHWCLLVLDGAQSPHASLSPGQLRGRLQALLSAQPGKTDRRMLQQPQASFPALALRLNGSLIESAALTRVSYWSMAMLEAVRAVAQKASSGSVLQLRLLGSLLSSRARNFAYFLAVLARVELLLDASDRLAFLGRQAGADLPVLLPETLHESAWSSEGGLPVPEHGLLIRPEGVAATLLGGDDHWDHERGGLHPHRRPPQSPLSLRPVAFLDEQRRRRLQRQQRGAEEAETYASDSTSSYAVFNPHPSFDMAGYPRGFPLPLARASIAAHAALLSPSYAASAQQRARLSCVPIVQQLLSSRSPDVDALQSMLLPEQRWDAAAAPEMADSAAASAEQSGLAVPFAAFSPLNGRSSVHLEAALFALPLPGSVSPAVSDIWRGYVLQTLLSYIAVNAQPANGSNGAVAGLLPACVMFHAPSAATIFPLEAAAGSLELLAEEQALYHTTPALLDLLQHRRRYGRHDLLQRVVDGRHEAQLRHPRQQQRSRPVDLLDLLQLLYVDLYEHGVLQPEDVSMIGLWRRVLQDLHDARVQAATGAASAADSTLSIAERAAASGVSPLSPVISPAVDRSTPVCILFNFPGTYHSIATLLSAYTASHHHVALLHPSPWSELDNRTRSLLSAYGNVALLWCDLFRGLFQQPCHRLCTRFYLNLSSVAEDLHTPGQPLPPLSHPGLMGNQTRFENFTPLAPSSSANGPLLLPRHQLARRVLIHAPPAGSVSRLAGEFRGCLLVGDDVFFNFTAVKAQARVFSPDMAWACPPSGLFQYNASRQVTFLHPSGMIWIENDPIGYQGLISQFLNLPGLLQALVQEAYGAGVLPFWAISDTLYLPHADGQMEIYNALVDYITAPPMPRDMGVIQEFSNPMLMLLTVRLAGRQYGGINWTESYTRYGMRYMHFSAEPEVNHDPAWFNQENYRWEAERDRPDEMRAMAFANNTQFLHPTKLSNPSSENNSGRTLFVSAVQHMLQHSWSQQRL